MTTVDAAALAAVQRFTAAFARQDVDGLMASMTDDCVFESTAPPDGDRHEGAAAVREAWIAFFAAAGDAVFEPEEEFGCGEWVVSTWRYRWAGGHVRGVDLFRVRDGLIAEKLAYVKG